MRKREKVLTKLVLGLGIFFGLGFAGKSGATLTVSPKDTIYISVDKYVDSTTVAIDTLKIIGSSGEFDTSDLCTLHIVLPSGFKFPVDTIVNSTTSNVVLRGTAVDTFITSVGDSIVKFAVTDTSPGAATDSVILLGMKIFPIISTSTKDSLMVIRADTVGAGVADADTQYAHRLWIVQDTIVLITPSSMSVHSQTTVSCTLQDSCGHPIADRIVIFKYVYGDNGYFVETGADSAIDTTSAGPDTGYAAATFYSGTNTTTGDSIKCYLKVYPDTVKTTNHIALTPWVPFFPPIGFILFVGLILFGTVVYLRKKKAMA